MKIDKGLYYNGIRFFDKKQSLMNEYLWKDDNSGLWSPFQSIRSDERIIGLQFNNEQGIVTHLSLLLGKVNEPTISREIRFPQMEIYPTLNQYKQFVSNSAFSQLDQINFKESNGQLTGIQLTFMDGQQSPLFESIYATTEQLKETSLIFYRHEFLDWLDCKENGFTDCTDTSGKFSGCYQSGACDSLIEPGWFNCYWYGRECEGLNIRPRPVQVEFETWLDCYVNTNSSAGECGDIDGTNLDCYTNAKCDNIADPLWFNCYWHEY